MPIMRPVVILTALLVAACGDKSTQRAEAPPRPVRVIQVADTNLIIGRPVPGQARSAREAMLSFRVAGRVEERRVKTGDRVTEGDVLAILDAEPYKAEAARATANLQRAQAAYKTAANQLDRDRQLLAKDFVSRARFESSEAAAKQAAADVRSAEAAERRAKLDLGYTELRAPFGGIVSAIFTKTFEDVRPQQAILRLIDPDEIEMVVNVGESVISYVPYLVDIKATFDAFPGAEIPAEVSEIGTEPSETTRTYPVTLILTPPPGVAILPGMAGRVRGKPGPQLAERTKGVAVPLSAIFSPDDAKGSFVWVVNEQTKVVHRVPVTLGEPVVGGVSVLEGPQAGSIVVAAGVHSLREGQAVRILSDGATTP